MSPPASLSRAQPPLSTHAPCAFTPMPVVPPMSFCQDLWTPTV